MMILSGIKKKFFCHFSIVALITLESCGLTVTRPKFEMSMAQEAFGAAKESGAEELSPREYRLAEVSYLKARAAYQRKYFDRAAQLAKICIQYSEIAEFNSIKAQVLGEREE